MAKIQLSVEEEDLEGLVEDIADAHGEDARVAAVAHFIASATPNGPIPSFLTPLVDRAEAVIYIRIYEGAKRWAQKLFRRSPARRAQRRRARRLKRGKD